MLARLVGVGAGVVTVADPVRVPPPGSAMVTRQWAWTLVWTRRWAWGSVLDVLAWELGVRTSAGVGRRRGGGRGEEAWAWGRCAVSR